MIELMPHASAVVLAGVTAFGITYVLTPLVRSLAVRFGLVARSAEDRWGRRVIARLGGAAMFVGFLAAALLWVPFSGLMPGLLLGAVLVFGLGLADDLRRMPPYAKLIGQLLIGCLVVSSGIQLSIAAPAAWLAIPASVFWIVLIMNSFNLLDNMDGLAAGVGAIAAVGCAAYALMAEQWAVVSLSVILLSVCLAFLRYNFPPAKIYMGDSGSHLLGLTLAILSIVGSSGHPTRLVSVMAGTS